MTGARMIPAHVRAEKPLRMGDLEEWDPSEMLGELARLHPGTFSKTELDPIRKIEGVGPQTRAIRELIQSKGYDSIVYRNTHEGFGGYDDTNVVPKDSYMVFDPVQIKSATGNSGAFDPSNPDIRYSVEPNSQGFYSQLERVVADPKTQATQKAGDWAKFLRDPKRRVKAEELKWTGLDDYLASREGQKVTKQEITDFLKENQVEVREVTRGDSIPPEAVEETLANDEELAGLLERFDRHDRYTAYLNGHNQLQVVDANTDELVSLGELPARLGDTAERISERIAEIKNRAATGSKNAGPAKYESYQQPGGTNYREMVLHRPVSDTGVMLRTPEYTAVSEEANKVLKASDLLGFDSLSEVRQAIMDHDDWATRFDIEPGNAPAIEKWRTLRKAPPKVKKDFQSSHWEEPNVLAHFRLNDRKGPKGGKILYVEEVQSDWAQKGRTGGFKKNIPPAKMEAAKDRLGAAKAEYDKALNTFWRSGKDPFTGPNKTIEDSELLKKWREVEASDEAYGMLQVESGPGKTVPGPFVTDTGAWTDLVNKRILRMAAEGGYDQVAWAPGVKQVDRYNSALRKAVDGVEWEKTPEGVHLKGFKNSQTDRGMRQEWNETGEVEDQWVLELDGNEGENYIAVEPRDDGNGWHAAIFNRDTPINEDIPWTDLDATTAEQAMDEATKKLLSGGAVDRSNRNYVVNTREKEDHLSDAIGKSMAERIINSPDQQGEFSGDDLKIDDTGMAKFYDKILPSSLERVGKKWGAKVRSGTGETSGEASTPQLRPFTKQDWYGYAGASSFEDPTGRLPKEQTEPLIQQIKLSVQEAGEGVKEVDADLLVTPDGISIYWLSGDEDAPKQFWVLHDDEFSTQAEAKAVVKSLWDQEGFWKDLAENAAGEDVIELAWIGPQKFSPLNAHTVDITPEMRAGVMAEGFPQFKVGAKSEAQTITLEGVRKNLPAELAKKVVEVEDGFIIDTPKGSITIRPSGDIRMDWDALETAHGRTARSGVEEGHRAVIGSTESIGRDALVKVVNEGVIPHEIGHVFLDHFATPREANAIKKSLAKAAEAEGRSIDEVFSDGFSDWFKFDRESREGETLIKAMYRRIYEFFAGVWQTLSPSLEGTYRKAARGTAFQRSPRAGQGRGAAESARRGDVAVTPKP